MFFPWQNVTSTRGLAPYVADLTALFRTDWHPAGHAWMMRARDAAGCGGWWMVDGESSILGDFTFKNWKSSTLLEQL